MDDQQKNRLTTPNILSNERSKYFCGSAALQSIYEYLNSNLPDAENTKYDKEKIINLNISLIEEDADLFALICKKSTIKDDANTITNILTDYDNFYKQISTVNEKLDENNSLKHLFYLSISFIFSTLSSSFKDLQNYDASDKKTIEDLLLNISNNCQIITKSNKHIGKDPINKIQLMNILRPVLAIFFKLVARKKNGKHPFSDKTSSYLTMEAIDTLEYDIFLNGSATIIDQQHACSTLDYLLFSIDIMINEIKTPSLKADFIYIQDYLKFSYSAFKGN